MKNTIDKFVGQNVLGNLLMKIREEIIKYESNT